MCHLMLRCTVKEGGEKERLSAIEAIGQLGPRAKEAIPDLLTIGPTGEPHHPYYSAAVDALHKIGPDSLPACFEALKVGNEDERLFAYWAIRAFADKDAGMRNRLYSAMLLEKSGRNLNAALLDLYQADALPTSHFGRLTEILKDEKATVENRQYAAAALARIDDAETKALLPYLFSLYSEKKTPWELRLCALSSFAQIGRDQKETIQRLKQVIADDNEKLEIRIGALVGLGKSNIPTSMEHAEHLLRLALASKAVVSVSLKGQILDVISNGQPGVELLPTLKALLDKEDMVGSNDRRIAKILIKIGRPANDFGPYIVDRLRATPRLSDQSILDYAEAIRCIQSQLGAQFSIDQVLGAVRMSDDTRTKLERIRAEIVK